MSDPRLDRPLWRGRTNVDALTIACIEHAESIGGHEFVVTQGSYQSTVAASAGTHDKGGAVDLRWCGHDSCIRALRQAGLAAWHRHPWQGPWPDHIHAVVVDHPLLAPSAARQVVAYRAGRNGLASNGADDGPRITPIPTPIWPWPEDDMPYTENQLTAIIRAAVRAELDPIKEQSRRIRQAIMQQIRALRAETKDQQILARLDKIAAALPEDDE